jgi:hypothetical protein
MLLPRHSILKILHKETVKFEKIPLHLQKDNKFIGQCLKIRPEFFYELPEDLQKVEIIYLTAFKSNVEIRSFTKKIHGLLDLFPSTESFEVLQEFKIPEFLRTKEIVFKMIEHGVSADILEILPIERDQNNEIIQTKEWKEFVTKCIQVNISTFFFEKTYELFFDDVEIVKKAIEHCVHTIFLKEFLVPKGRFISEKLREDESIRRELSLLCLHQNLQCIKYVEESFLNDNEFILKFIKEMKRPGLLENMNFEKSLAEYEKYVSQVYKEFDKKFQSKSFLNAAVRNNGMFLKFMKLTDKENLKDFIYSPPESIKHALTDDCMSDEIMESIVKQNGFCLTFGHESIQKNINITLMALEQVSKSQLSNFHKELFMESLDFHEPEFIFQALDINKKYLNFVKSEFITEEILKKAMDLDKEYYRFCFEESDLNKEYSKFYHLKTYKNKFQQDAKYREFILETQDEVLILNYLKNRKKLNIYKKINVKFRNDYEFNMKAVKCNGMVLQWLNDDFNQDFDIVLAAVTQNAEAITFAKHFENKPQILIQLMKQGKHHLSLMNENLRINKEIILQSLNLDGLNLEFVPNKLKDKNIVLLAVRKNGMSLKYAPEEFKRDYFVVFQAVRNTKESIQFALLDQMQDAEDLQEIFEEFKKSQDEEYNSIEDLKNQEEYKIIDYNEIKKKLVSENSNDEYQTFETIREVDLEETINLIEILKNEETILKYLESNPFHLKDIPKEIQNEKMVDFAVSKKGMTLKYVYDQLKTKKLIMNAVSNNGMSLEFATEEFKNDADVVCKAIRQNPLSLEFASKELKKDREIVLKAISYGDGSCLKWADDKLKSDEEIVLKSLNKNGNNLNFTFVNGESAFDTPRFILQAASNFKQILGDPLFKHHAGNKSLMLDLIDLDPSLFKYASEELIKQNPEEIFLKAVKNGFTLKDRFSEPTDKIIECAIVNNANEINYINESDISFDSFMKWIYLNHECFLKFNKWELFKKDELIELCFASVHSSQPPNNSGYNVKHFPDSINAEDLRKLLIRCLKINCRVYDCIPQKWNHFKNEKEFILLGRGYMTGEYLPNKLFDLLFKFEG